MDKSKISQKDTPRQETVYPAIPEDEMAIIRKTDETGERSYCNSDGDHIDTYEDDLYNFLTCLFDRIDGVIHLLGDDAYNEFGYILDPIIRHAQWQLYEIFEMMSRSIGEVNIDLICRNNWPYKDGRVVGVTLEPPKPEAEEMEVPNGQK